MSRPTDQSLKHFTEIIPSGRVKGGLGGYKSGLGGPVDCAPDLSLKIEPLTWKKPSRYVVVFTLRIKHREIKSILRNPYEKINNILLQIQVPLCGR